MSLFSTECRRNENCHDAWFWPAAFLYSLFVAIFLVTKPPIVPILNRSHISYGLKRWIAKKTQTKTGQKIF